jgi:hypothetical protein
MPGEPGLMRLTRGQRFFRATFKSNRLVYFDMRNAIAAEQTRILTIDLYKRQLARDGVSAQKTQEKIDQSNQMARKNVLIMTPQIKKLISEWEALFPLEGIGEREASA